MKFMQVCICLLFCFWCCKTVSYKLIVILDLPGVRKECLDISITDGFVTIKGERQHEYTEDNILGSNKTERTYGKVSRTLSLPSDTDISKSEAKFDFGVLKLVFPKKVGGSGTSKHLFIK